ncbi:hypothetical protein AB6805_30545 [Chitinophaga sp. RCC_12]|uniref:hypothetical protein n=1 Tax=Chitinophaga sp. RCC_12 TaxID=3239226 RepID=UPI0035232848
MKKLLLILFLAPCAASAQKFFVEPTDKGAEKVIIDKLIHDNHHVTFKVDSADYIIRPNVKRMSMGRARGGILLINGTTGDVISQSKDLWGAAKLANGYDNPVADVLKKTSVKYLPKMIEALIN